MTSARIYDSWEEEQAATQKVAALARRSNPDDLLSELLPARSPQRANAATVMQVLSEMAAQGHGSLRWNLMTHEVEVEGMALSPTAHAVRPLVHHVSWANRQQGRDAHGPSFLGAGAW